MRICRRLFGVVLVLACIGYVKAPFAQGRGTAERGALLTGVWLIDGTGAPAVENAWIRIEGNRIAAMGRGTPPPAGDLRVLDLKGRTVVPGLADMHVHLRTLPQAKWTLKLALAHGVTTIRDTSDSFGDTRTAREWAAHELRLPHLFVSGPSFPGAQMEANLEFLKAGPSTAAQLEELAAFNVDFIKVHNWISSAALKQIGEFAAAHNIYLIGHVPLGMTTLQAIDLGMKSLEHVRLKPSEESDDPEVAAKYPIDLPIMLRENHWASFDPNSNAIQRTLDAWAKRKDRFFLDPTLVPHAALAHADDPAWTASPDMSLVSPALMKSWQTGAQAYGEMTKEDLALAKKSALAQGKFVAMAHARGIRIVTGTDTPIPWVVPGAGLLKELELLVGGGLTPVEAIQASTGTSAELLRTKDRGTIAPGQIADLVIVRGNVAADITAIRNIEQVVLGGQLHERAQLLEEARQLARAHQPPATQP